MKLLHLWFITMLMLIFILITQGCIHKSQNTKFTDLVKQEYQTDKQLQEWRK